jgi:hypothetical protein
MLVSLKDASPKMDDLLHAIDDEHHWWSVAGARKLDALGPALVPARVGRRLERWSGLTWTVFFSVRKTIVGDHFFLS